MCDEYNIRPSTVRTIGIHSDHVDGSVFGVHPASPACIASNGTSAGHRLSSYRCVFHLPAPLCSTSVTSFHRSYECSDSCMADSHHSLSMQVSLFHALSLPAIPSPTTQHRPTVALSYAFISSIGLLSRYGSLCLRIPRQVWISRITRSLITMPGRIEFVNLRTGRSPPVASHPVSRRRSYSWLHALRTGMVRTCTFLAKCAGRRTSPAFKRNK